MKQTWNKLVRDNIPEQIRANGEIAKTKTLRARAYRRALKDKLQEEAAEVAAAEERTAIIAELADVQEVLLALYAAYDIECKEVTATARKKRAQKGGFQKRLFLEYTT